MQSAIHNETKWKLKSKFFLNAFVALFQDVLRLTSHLPMIFDNYQVPYENWNHLDFIWGIDADTLVYTQLMANMAKAEIELR